MNPWRPACCNFTLGTYVQRVMTIRAIRWLPCLVLLFAGCTIGSATIEVEPWREVPAPALAADATAAIMGALGMTEAPEVHWYGGDGLDAGCERMAWHPLDNPSICVGGEELYGVITVALPDGYSIRRTQFGHEMTHYYGELTGDGDPNHDRHDLWWAGGALERALTAIDAM